MFLWDYLFTYASSILSSSLGAEMSRYLSFPNQMGGKVYPHLTSMDFGPCD